MSSIYSELSWLPKAPAEFGAQLKAIASTPGAAGKELQRLAACSLDLNQLNKLAKATARLHADGRSLDPLVPFRLALLSNGTLDLMSPALIASALRHGIDLQVIQPAYDQVAQE